MRSDGITPSVSARAHAYETLAALARRVPHQLRADAQLPAELFAHLSREDAGARTPLHDALSALADVDAAAATDGVRLTDGGGVGCRCLGVDCERLSVLIGPCVRETAASSRVLSAATRFAADAAAIISAVAKHGDASLRNGP